MRSGISAQVGSTKRISRRRRFGVLAAAVAGVFALRAANAVDYTWDNTGTAGVAPAGGTGVWDATLLRWTNDNGATYIAWPNTDPNLDTAIFGGAAGTVSLGTGIFANALTFNATGYVIDNGGNAANTLTASGFAVTSAADSATISAIIAGSGGLTKSGAGTLTISGANTYTGNTNVFDGTLVLGAGGNINAAGDLNVFFGTFDIGANSATANIVGTAAGGSITGSGTLTASSYQIGDGNISANLAGATASLIKSSSGTLILSGTNTFGGGVTINGGVVSISADANLGASPVGPTAGNLAINNGTLRTTATLTLDSNRGILLGTGGGTFDVASGTTTTYGGVIDGSTGLTKSGAGTLALNGANTYSGSTTVIGGTLTLAGGGTINTASNLLVSGGTFDIGAASTTVGAVSLFSGSIAGTGGTLTGTSYAVQAGSISAILAGPGGLTKTSASGTVTLNAANTYSGATQVNQGTLALGAGGSIDASSNLTVAGGTFALGANSTSANAVSLTSGSITGTGGGVLTGTSYAVQSGTISAILAGGSASLTKTGTGTVTLSAANTYGGSTNVNAGTLTIGAGGNISNSNALNVGGGTLDVGTNNISIGPVTLTSGNINGTAVLPALPGIITAPSYAVQSGIIGARISGGSSPLTKDGSGTVTLRGANSYGGGTTVNAGTLVSANSSALSTGTITLNGGTLQVGETPTTNGLFGQYYDGAPTNFGAVNPDLISLAAFSTKYPGTPSFNANTTTGGVTVFDFSNSNFGNNAPFSTQGDNSTDNVAARWSGKIRIDNAGPTSFFTTSDDASMIFIDGVQVVNNDFYQGATERSGIVNLAAGYHDITILFCEATGGAGVTASYTPFGGSKQLIPNSVLYNTPASGASGFASANPVNVTASSTLDLSLAAPASTHNLGALTRIGNTTLTVLGLGRTLNFAGTTLSGNPGDNIGFDTAADINTGLISDGSSTGLILTKNGAGSLILNNAGNDLNGTTIDLRAGGLRLQGSGAGADPLGGASVLLNGGSLSLSNPAGGTDFNPALTMVESATIERAGNTSDTLSSALSIPAGKNLSLSVLGGSLSRSVAIGGDGALTKMGGGTLSFDGTDANTYAGSTTVNAGTLRLNKPAGTNAVGNLTVNYGRVQWLANEQIPDTATINLNGGGILDLNGKTETIGTLNTTGGSTTGSTLIVNNITKTGGNTTTIGAQLVSSGGTYAVSGGTLRLTNNASGAGTNSVNSTAVNVSGGGNLRLDLAVGGSNPIGSNAINLNNGGLSLAGATSYDAGGLSGQFFKVTPFGLNTTNQLAETGSAVYLLRGILGFDSLPNLNGAMANLMAIPYGAGGLTQTINFGGNAIGANSYASNLPYAFNAGTLNVGTKWAGKINIATAGLTTFFTQSDDGSMLFVDGQQVVYNNFFQGITDRSGTVNLSAGLHDIVIGFYQGGGSGEVIASYQPVGGTRQVIPSSVLLAPNITDSNPINASGISTINVMDAAQANTGPLTVSGQLNIIGGAVAPSSTTFDGNVTILTTGSGLVAQDVAETNGPVSLTKTGGGAMTVNGTSSLTGALNVNMGFMNVNGPSNQSVTNINALGTLKMTHLGALNPSLGGDVNVNNGGTLDVSVANADLSKVKVNFGGKLSLGAGQNTGAGAIVPNTPIAGTFEIRGFDIGTNYSGVRMTPNSTINILTGGANRIYGSDVELTGTGNTFISTSGNVTTFNGTTSGSGGLTLVSNTELRLEGNQTYTGTTIAETGIIKSREGGNLQSISKGITYGGELWADDGGNNFSMDRYSDTGVIDMHGGALRHFGKGGSTSSETFGTVNALGGVTIDSQATAANTVGVMTITNLVRPVGGRINFPNTNNLGSSTATQTGRIFINNFKNGTGALAPFTSGNLKNGIIGGGVTVGNDFATYTDAFGVTALTTFRTTADSTATPWLGTENVKRGITAQENLAGSKTINSLTITNAAGQNLELTTFNLILETGGFSQSGGGTLTVNATGGSATTGTITANGGELFALAANTIVFNNAIIDNGATPVALTIGGGGTIRLASINNKFTGGVNISSSTLNAQAAAQAATPFNNRTLNGNTINFTGGGTLQLRDNFSGSGVNIPYNNAVNVFANATIDVNNGGANNTNTFQMGNLLMDSGRTLTTTGGNSYRLQFAATTLNGDATFATNSADTLLGALNDLGVGKTLFKNGGNTLFLTADATNWSGAVVVNAGTVHLNTANGLGAGTPRVVVNNSGIIGFSRINQNLSNVTFNNGAGLRVIGTMDSSTPGTMPTSPLTLLEIGNTAIGGNWDNVPLNPAGATIRTAPTLGGAATYASDLALPGPVGFDTPNQTLTVTGNITGVTGSIIKSSGNTLNLAPATGSNTYGGGTFILGGTLNANTANSLGTGPVTATAGTLGYNVANPSGGAVISANGAEIQALVGQIALGAINSIGNDRFDIATGNVVSGDTTRLGLLSRFGNSSIPSNVNLAPGAIVGHAVPGGGTINDLGTASDLFFGLAGNWAGANINIGANTPWMGLSTDRSGRQIATGDIIVDDGSNGGTQPATFTSMTIQGINSQTFTLGNGGTAATPPAVNVTIKKSNAASGKVDVHLVGRVAMNAQSTNFDGVNKFVGDFGSFVMLNAFNTLGGGSSTSPVPLELLNGSVIDIGGGATPAPGALNGNLLMRAGSVFRLDDTNQLQGSGSIFADPGSIFMLRNANVINTLTTQLTGGSVPGAGLTNAKGAIFRMEADNIINLDAACSDAGIFSIVGGNRTEGVLTLNADPTMLSGGLTIYDNNSRSYTATAGLNIGSGGAFFSSNGNANGTFTLTIATTTPINVSAGAALTIGSPKIDFFDKNGHVQFDAPFTGPVASMNKITSGDLVINNASAAVAGKLVTGDIVGGGGGGAIRLGAANSNVSARNLAGTVANNIILNDRVRSDVYLDLTPAGRAQVLQKFTVDGTINTDGRKFLAQRTAGANTGVDMQNVILKSGMISLDENNTDVRINLTMAGDGIVGQAVTNSDPWDFINIASDVAGTHRTLQQGRTGDILSNIPIQSVFGNISGDVTINQVRGGLKFEAGSQILAPVGAQTGVVINSLGNDVGPGGQGYIEIRAGQDGTGALANATVNLGGGTAIQIFADESNGAQITNNPNLNVNIAANSSGTVGSNRNLVGTTNGRVLLNSVNMGANSTLSMTSANNVETSIGAVNMAGNGTIVNVASDDRIVVGTVAAGANNVTFDGTRHTQVTGNLTGAQLASNGFVDFNPGAANTSNVNVASATVRGAITAASGTTNFGTATISGTAGSTLAGLREGAVPGGFNTADANPGNFVRLGPLQAQVQFNNTDPGMVQGWTSNLTYVYTGQIKVPNSNGDGTGTIAVGEVFDDSVQFKVDGSESLRDTTWNNSTSSGAITLSEGWHDVEFRFGQGGGGVGPNVNGGWNGLLAIGLQIGNTGPFDNKTDGVTAGGVTGATQARYTFPIDNGSMNLFRVALPASGDVNVGAGAELRAGALSNIANANLNGAAGSAATLTLVDTGGTVNSTISNVAANGDAAISFGTSSPIAAENLNVAAAANLSLSGGGTMIVSTGHTLGDGSNININAGKLVINSTAGPGGGGITVNSGGTLGGNGNILGTVTVNSGGHVAPGNSVGTISVGVFTLNSGSVLDVEGDAGGFDRINVTIDNAFSIAGPSTIALIDLGGVVAGDYVLIDYGVGFTGNFSDLSLASTTFGSYTASLINDTGDTSIKLHVALGGAPQWNVDADGSWTLAANWLPQIVPDGVGTGASFLGKITAPRTVTLDGNHTVGSLNFDNAFKYTIAPGTGGTLSIGDATTAGAVTVTSGSHEISADVAINGDTSVTVAASSGLTLSGGLAIAAGKTATKVGDGSMTISGTQNHGVGATLRVTRGTLNLNANSGSGSAATSHLNLNVSGNVDGASSRITLGENQDLAELTVAQGDAGTQTLDLASDAVGSGQFRLVTVYASNLAAAKTALWNSIKNANVATALDRFDGIVDSGLHPSSGLGLAVLSGSDHVSIRQTRIGDLNLDGNVTISDFIDLASNFNTVGTATWQEGDLNYDGNVTISDFIDLASNFGASYAGGAAPISVGDQQTLASFASSIGADPSVVGSAVPEPAALSLLAVGAMGLMSRRRRKA